MTPTRLMGTQGTSRNRPFAGSLVLWAGLGLDEQGVTENVQYHIAERSLEILRSRRLLAQDRKSTELVEQRLRVLEIGGVEALGEPAVDWREQVAGLSALALMRPQPGEAGRGAEFPGSGALRASAFKTANKLPFSLRPLGCRSPQQQLTALVRSDCFKGFMAGSSDRTSGLLERLKGCVDLPGGRMRLCEEHGEVWHHELHLDALPSRYPLPQLSKSVGVVPFYGECPASTDLVVRQPLDDALLSAKFDPLLR